MAKQAAEQSKKPQPGVRPYIPSGLEMVMLRNQFYQKNYRRMTSLCLLLILVIAGLIGFIFYQYYTQPTPSYFATSADGKLLKIDPLSRPGISKQELFQFAIEAATSSYTYDFVNYRNEFEKAREYYTSAGYNKLLKAIEESRNLKAVIERKLVTTARVTGTPQLDAEDPYGLAPNGRYYWKLEMPMVVEYGNNNPANYLRQNLIVKLTIVRVPIWESSRGIGISSIVVYENLSNQQSRNPNTQRGS